jgi:hypothetical protein
MLENFGVIEAVGWIQRCSIYLGEAGGDPRNDPMETCCREVAMPHCRSGFATFSPVLLQEQSDVVLLLERDLVS